MRPSHWAPRHRLRGSSEPPPKLPISLRLPVRLLPPVLRRTDPGLHALGRGRLQPLRVRVGRSQPRLHLCSLVTTPSPTSSTPLLPTCHPQANLVFTFGSHAMMPEEVREMISPAEIHWAYDCAYALAIPLYVLLGDLGVLRGVELGLGLGQGLGLWRGLRLQPRSHRITASITYGYRLRGLLHTFTASITCGYSLHHIRLQAPSHTVTASITYGCRLLRLLRLRRLQLGRQLFAQLP